MKNRTQAFDSSCLHPNSKTMEGNRVDCPTRIHKHWNSKLGLGISLRTWTISTFGREMKKRVYDQVALLFQLSGCRRKEDLRLLDNDTENRQRESYQHANSKSSLRRRCDEIQLGGILRFGSNVSFIEQKEVSGTLPPKIVINPRAANNLLTRAS